MCYCTNVLFDLNKLLSPVFPAAPPPALPTSSFKPRRSYLLALAAANIKVAGLMISAFSLNSTATEAKTEELKRKQARSCWRRNRGAEQMKEEAAR